MVHSGRGYTLLQRVSFLLDFKGFSRLTVQNTGVRIRRVDLLHIRSADGDGSSSRGITGGVRGSTFELKNTSGGRC